MYLAIYLVGVVISLIIFTLMLRREVSAHRDELNPETNYGLALLVSAIAYPIIWIMLLGKALVDTLNKVIGIDND